MKKIFALAVIALSVNGIAQAQIGRSVLNAAASSAKSKVEKSLTKKAEDAATKKMNQMFGLGNNSDLPATPQDFMGRRPALPTQNQIVEYGVEKTINPSSMKLLVHPVARFSAKITMISMDAVAGSTTNGNVNQNAYSNSSLRALGIDPVEFNNMSEEEQEACMNKIAEQRLNAYGLTSDDFKAMENMSEEEQDQYIMQHIDIEKMANNPVVIKQAQDYSQQVTEYQPAYDLLDRFDAIGARADSLLDASDRYANQLWDSKYANQPMSEKLMRDFYNEYIPVFLANFNAAQEIRKSEQVPLGMEIDATVQKISSKQGGQVPTLFLMSLGHVAAQGYINDCLRFGTIFIPKK